MVLYLGVFVLITVATMHAHREIAVGAGQTLLPIAAVLLVLPAAIKADHATNPEWIVTWAVLMIPVLIFLASNGIYAAGIVPVFLLSILLMLKAVSARPRV